MSCDREREREQMREASEASFECIKIQNERTESGCHRPTHANITEK